jgi:tetratricopeptide (TPR) repeat protein
LPEHGETPTAASSGSTAFGRLPAPWLGGAAIVAAIALGVVLSMRQTSPVPVPAVTNSTAVAAATPRPESSPVDADGDAAATPGVSYAAIESNRAAAAAYATGDFATALAQLEAAVAASPDDAAVRNNLGQLLVRQGRAAEALPHFDEAVRLDSRRWEFRFNRARTYGLLNRWSEAVTEYRAAAQAFPEDHATLYNLGLALLRVRDFGAAASTLEQAVAAAPDEHEFLITLGTAYVGAAQPDRARIAFERFLQLAPDDAEAPKVKALIESLIDSAP